MQKGSAAPSPSPADGPNVLLRVITGTRTGEGGGGGGFRWPLTGIPVQAMAACREGGTNAPSQGPERRRDAPTTGDPGLARLANLKHGWQAGRRVRQTGLPPSLALSPRDSTHQFRVSVAQAGHRMHRTVGHMHACRRGRLSLVG